MVFVPDNYEAIGSCVLSTNAVKPGACEISVITVLIWDRVLQLAIVGLLIGYARDLAASIGCYHLLLTRAEGVVESILRVTGWETCACKGFGGDGAAGLCAESVFGGGEDGQTQDNDQPDDSGQTEEIDGAEESGSVTGVVNVEEDEETNDQIRRKITLDELIETAAKEKWDLVIDATAEKRSFEDLEPGEVDESSTSKRPKIEFNSRCNNILGCADRQQEQVMHKLATKAGSSLSKSSGLSPVPEKPTSKLQKVPPPPVIRASSLTINSMSSVKNGGKYPYARGTRGRGDPRNAKMRAARQREAQATSRSTSSEVSTASKHLLLLQEMANSEKPPKEPIERGSSVPKVLWQRPPDPTDSSMLVAPRRASFIPTASKNSGFPPTALDSGDSTGHGYGMLDDNDGALQRPEEIPTLEVQALIDNLRRKNNERIVPATTVQRPEVKLDLEVQAPREKVQRVNRDCTDHATRLMHDLKVQSPTNAIRVPDIADESAKGVGNTSRMSSTAFNRSGKEKVCSVMKSRIPKNAQVNGYLEYPAKFKAHVSDCPAASAASLNEGQPQQQLKEHPPLIDIPPKPSRETWLGNPVTFGRATSGIPKEPRKRSGAGDWYRPGY